MLRRILPRRVVVSLGVATALVGGIVLAGALLRHRDPPRHTPASSVSTTTAAAGARRP